jgi:putative Mg2+ transporter-C (MgtC) family protein
MIPPDEIIIRLLLGAVLGGIIGFEREVHGQAAGFRTQLLVCVAAVLIMIVSENYYFHLLLENPELLKQDSAFRIDPARIAAGAVIGIGFLGAGAIIKSGFVIRGLTTAASIWIISAIGLAIGAGLYFEGITTSLITIIALLILRKLESNIRILQYRRISVSARISENAEEKIAAIFSDCGVTINSIEYERDMTKDEIVFVFSISTKDRDAIKDIFYKLGTIDLVKKVRIAN